MDILCVIDLQGRFVDFDDESALIEKAAGVVDEFKTKNEPIIFVEYENYGDTAGELLNKVRNYALHTTVYKCNDDGSYEIDEAIKNNDWKPKSITICGCNFSYCVKDTVLGLKSLYPDVPIKLEMPAVRDSPNYPDYDGTRDILEEEGILVNGFSLYE